MKKKQSRYGRPSHVTTGRPTVFGGTNRSPAFVGRLTTVAPRRCTRVRFISPFPKTTASTNFVNSPESLPYERAPNNRPDPTDFIRLRRYVYPSQMTPPPKCPDKAFRLCASLFLHPGKLPSTRKCRDRTSRRWFRSRSPLRLYVNYGSGNNVYGNRQTSRCVSSSPPTINSLFRFANRPLWLRVVPYPTVRIYAAVFSGSFPADVYIRRRIRNQFPLGISRATYQLTVIRLSKFVAKIASSSSFVLFETLVERTRSR